MIKYSNESFITITRQSLIKLRFERPIDSGIRLINERSCSVTLFNTRTIK